MIGFFNHKRRFVAVVLLILFVFQIVPVNTVYALTSGPSQPEVQSFQPAGTSDMVDLFSGDFSYNIPLFELPGPNGGYPFNLFYQSGINTDQEASWVGLGWNLQPGAINRQMRGLPDEFDGTDLIETKMSMAPNITVGAGVGAGVEVFGADGLSLNLGLSVYQNNYRGAGYSIDGSLGFQKSASSGATAGIGLGFSLDSNEGVNLSPSLSLGGKNVNFGLGIGYSSKEGLSNLSIDASLQKSQTFKTKKGETMSSSRTIGATSANLSFAHPGYTPQITSAMESFNTSATIKIGGSFWGVFGSPYITGFYNRQRLANDKKWISAPAFGYLNYAKAATVDNAIMDINREKDGIVTKITPNLPIPSLTYDIYSVSGQGISAMYRPMRNDYGSIKDQLVSSGSNGISGGADLGPALVHGGVNLSVNYAQSVSGFWKNPMTEKNKFSDQKIGSLYEPWYFKAHGDPSAEAISSNDKIGGDKAVRVKLNGFNNEAEATEKLEFKKNGIELADLTVDTERKSRNQTIQPYTNDQLLKIGEVDPEILPHFKISYQDENGDEHRYDRTSRPGHHIAAYTALTPEGLRYNYGIPAYNETQEEYTYSVSKNATEDIDRVSIDLSEPREADEPNYNVATDKYLRRVKTPAYAHSYLLTSILGPDYVDVGNDGVTNDDLGYWVKFTYKNTTHNSTFKWRDPFSQAHLHEGWKSDPRDDKGSFTYGEKEMWYLAKAETKSHIAEFEISARADGKGVSEKLQNEDLTGQSVYRLDKITLYTRLSSGAVPIKSVYFTYDYSLCQCTFNSTATPEGTAVECDDEPTQPRGGKLTLKEVFFTYGNSLRGSLNPYLFTYGQNPTYSMLSYDRWGNYKPNDKSEGAVMNNDFPYVQQDVSNKQTIDDNAAAWSLSKIQLPSGGKVIVDYEADDYAYVQHKQAMQMTAVVDPYTDISMASNSSVFSLRDDYSKVRFKLEKQIPVPGVEEPDFQSNEVKKYLDLTSKQLYFKFFISLRKPLENKKEYIAGYVDLDLEQGMGLERVTENSNFYTYGYFHVKKEKGNEIDRNPFSMRAWQHLRTNQPELANSTSLPATDVLKDQIQQMRSVGSTAEQIKKIFKGFYKWCSEKGWGREVTVGKAWVRLKSPDKIKYGGGLRVKQITMKDNWKNDGINDDEEGVYGQVYDYTTTESEGGPVISSGVASYEPFVGGDENPLRYTKKYTESVPLRADNNLYFEYPINESYYPGAQVGYSKVTVTSLASASQSGKSVNNAVFPSGGARFGTSGKTVHEFYTAKDFPVITDETESDNRPHQISAIIPFIGNVSVSKLTASQGYSIVTNDMHGKQKKVSNYRQSSSGAFEPEPISWVKYNYASTPRFYQQEQVFSVANKFVDNNDQTLSLPTAATAGTETFTLGQETDFFMDMRKFEDNSYTGGVRVNVDVLFAFIFTTALFTGWPSVGQSENQLRTAVTNKIIFKSGIMESVEAFDGGSLVKTSNVKWDKRTGAVVLTSVNNNFDAPVFSYNILAHTKYQGMGAAYQNAGLTYTATNVQAVSNQANQYRFTLKENLPASALQAGDEVLLYNATGSALTTPLAHVVYTGEENGTKRWYSEQSLTATSYKALIVRSGYRNQLSVSAGSITALEDPTTQETTRTFLKTIQVPK
jgi:hypothetical protein